MEVVAGNSSGFMVLPSSTVFVCRIPTRAIAWLFRWLVRSIHHSSLGIVGTEVRR